MTKQPTLVTTPTALAGLLPHLLHSPRISVDTESNSFYAYYERLCVLQISTEEGDYVIDPFMVEDLSPLSEVFANPGIEKIFHAAQEDVRLIKKTIPGPIENVFDTMLGARTAGWKEVGLAACLKNHFHVVLNKKYQRSDWGRRPLSAEQIEYAAKDTHYLARLRDLLHHELVRMGRWEEALEQFAWAARMETPAREFDVEGFRKLTGARELDARQLAILRELFLYREERARAVNRPVFMVLPDILLVRLAKLHPRDAGHLRTISGMTSYVLAKHTGGILDAVARGRSAALVAPPPRRTGPKPMDGKQMARYERIRQWRMQRAASRGVEPDVILPGQALKALALLDGGDPGALAFVPGLGPTKRKLYGIEILRLLLHRK